MHGHLAIWQAVAEYVEPTQNWLCWLRQVGVLHGRKDAEALVRRQMTRHPPPCHDWTPLHPKPGATSRTCSPPTLLAQVLRNDHRGRFHLQGVPVPLSCEDGMPAFLPPDRPSSRPWQDLACRYLGLGHYLMLCHSPLLRGYFFRHDGGGNGWEEQHNYEFYRTFVPSPAKVHVLSAWQALRHLTADHVPTDIVVYE